ncbi:MAG: hypothetical protein FD123_1111 [Bacteroidetes bacterium]|nr:MAG: hypothetical protein FD123_1111 [Bacteroidota bacterium]
MHKKLFVLFLLLFSFVLPAQPPLTFNSVASRAPAGPASAFVPEPGAVLNHTQVMFEYPGVKNAADYRLVIEELVPVVKTGKPDTLKKIVIEQVDRTPATLVSGLEFGKSYSWYFIAFDPKGNPIAQSPAKRFSILPLPPADPAKNRVRVLKKSKDNTGLFTLDYMHAIIDRNGNPVWCLRPVPGKISESDLIRDIRVTPQGTITMLSTQHIYELNTAGKILWTGPDDGKVSGTNREYYHHDFKRLPNGNYMVLGNEIIIKKVPGGTDTVRVNFGTIIEYTFWGKPVWVWRSKDYFTNDSEIFNSRNEQGKTQASLHLNAFSVDEKGEYVYAGFRDLNRILKIEKATGQVAGDYGGKLFWHQHDANILPDGNIALFNNDSVADPKITSSAMIIAPPARPGEQPKVAWKFDCKMDEQNDGKSIKMGSMDLLPNGNYLINMGGVNRVVEVSKDKKIAWDILVEAWSEKEKKWIESKQYRAHYASSLYPCYFTAFATTETWSDETKMLQVTINNEGTEADQYKIMYRSKGDGSPPVQADFVFSLGAGKSGLANVNLLKLPPKGSALELKITSVTNPEFSRTIIVPYQK